MNIFFLHETPELSAKYLVDKHIVKMPLESAQMLSTAHRLLDGHLTKVAVEKNGKTKIKKQWLMPGETANNPSPLYKVAHAKHPSTVWTMESAENYQWHFELFCHMLKEYTRRYGKVHRSSQLLSLLVNPPQNIPKKGMTAPIPAMPDTYKVPGDPIESYRRYYAGEKWRFAKWKKPEGSEIPEWFTGYMQLVWRDARFKERQDTLFKIAHKKTCPTHVDVLNKALELSR